jgi:hypothetical protein
MDANRETQLEIEIGKTKEELSGLGNLRPGSLSTQFNVCGTPGCKCKAAPPQKHGPYYQVSFTRKGKHSVSFRQGCLNSENQSRRLRPMRKGAAWDNTYEKHCRQESRRPGPDLMPGGRAGGAENPIRQNSGPRRWNGPDGSASTQSVVPWG